MLDLPAHDKPVMFRATEHLYGCERYDYCMVEFTDSTDDDDDLALTRLCPARIEGFFTYKSSGIPTPRLVQQEDWSLDQCVSNCVRDEQLYAVVHTAADYVSWERLCQDFVVPFQLGDVKSCVFIVPVDCIVDPLFVFRDYGGSSGNFFCALPYRKWGEYYRSRIV